MDAFFDTWHAPIDPLSDQIFQRASEEPFFFNHFLARQLGIQ